MLKYTNSNRKKLTKLIYLGDTTIFLTPLCAEAKVDAAAEAFEYASA